jgi:hypothetical protein
MSAVEDDANGIRMIVKPHGIHNRGDILGFSLITLKCGAVTKKLLVKVKYWGSLCESSYGMGYIGT